MKLQYLTVIFLIIAIPIILVTSYYMKIQIDTLNLQNLYNIKLTDATREAIEAFEINTVEWDSSYSSVSDSKRRDIQSSINTFIDSLSNNLSSARVSKDIIKLYIPAIAYTLYDGIYIYTSTEIPDVEKTADGYVKLDLNGNPTYTRNKTI